MHTFLSQYACILLASLQTVTSSMIQARRASKIDEFNSTDCSNLYPDGHLDDAHPTWHHQPPIDECIGIDPSTVSVRIQTGTGEAAAIGFYVPGLCAIDDTYANITFDKNIDGGSSCHAVVRDGNNPDTTRVHDIFFPAQ